MGATRCKACKTPRRAVGACQTLCLQAELLCVEAAPDWPDAREVYSPSWGSYRPVPSVGDVCECRGKMNEAPRDARPTPPNTQQTKT